MGQGKGWQNDNMERELHSIKWIDNNTATRLTNEVNLHCEIFDEGGLWSIKLLGTADHEHHLVEDAAILLKKMAEVKCGGGH